MEDPVAAPAPAPAPVETPTAAAVPVETATAAPVAAAAATAPTEAKSSRKYSMTEDAEVNAAKAYLTQTSARTNTNLYDHLTHLLVKILEQKPDNAADIFENLSADVKRLRFHPESYDSPAAVQRARETAASVEMANLQKAYFQMEKDDAPGDIPDIMDLANLFEWAGVSLGKEETFLTFLAIRKLVAERSLQSARLFGKITGTEKDYIIVESERTDGETDAEEPAPEPAAEDAEANAGFPKSKFKPAAPVPKESSTGVNRYMYFVCNHPGGEWTRLPDATPSDIQAARKIRKAFTGNLTNKIVSYPPFTGTEASYLRAQIARIASATVISPNGYYKFDDDEEPAEGAPATVVLNTEFEWPTHETLKQLDSWVHHVPYILPQGRTSWISTRPQKEEGNEEEGGAPESDDPPEEPEIGPSILTTVLEDAAVGDGIPSWSVRSASLFSPAKFAPVFLRSNRWPGAFTVGFNDKFASIYVGNGLKELGKPFVPEALEPVQVEFGVTGGPGTAEEIVEKADPSLDEEQAFIAENTKGEEGGEEEEEAEEDA